MGAAVLSVKGVLILAEIKEPQLLSLPRLQPVKRRPSSVTNPVINGIEPLKPRAIRDSAEFQINYIALETGGRMRMLEYLGS